MGSRLIVSGYIVLIVAIVMGQLLWLPAPLFNDSRWEWIAVIDYVYYSLLLIPALFMSGTILLVNPYKQSEKKPTKIGYGLAITISLSALYVMVCIVLMAWIEAIVGVVLLVILPIVFLIYTRKQYERKRATLYFVVGVVLYSSILAVLICPIPYQVTHPFFTFNVGSYAQLADEPKQRDEAKTERGRIEGVLVADRPAFAVDYLYSKWFKHIELEKREKSDLSIHEQYSRVVTQKVNSNRLAQAYAWQNYSGEQTIKPIGIRVVSVIENSAAWGRLEAGDIIKEINGASLYTLPDLSEQMTAVKPGEMVVVKVVTMAGELRQYELTTQAAGAEPERTVLGIYIEQAVEKVDERLNVNYASYLAHFGGPSHGAMLTLSLLNQLHDHQLIGDLHIAGTGTIELDGSIGMVGGIKHKAYAVSRTSADVFFVPQGAYEWAREGAPKLNIVEVQHIDDILEWISKQKDIN